MLRRRAADHTAVMEKAGGSEHRTNVFLVEDSASIRSRLSEMLGAVEGVSIVGEAESPAAAIDGILRTQPDSVVLDMHLTGGTGIEVLRKVCPVAPHIVLSCSRTTRSRGTAKCACNRVPRTFSTSRRNSTRSWT